MTPEEIKKLRTKLKLSQEGFARILGISCQTVNRWERGLSKPSGLALARIQSLIQTREVKA